MQNGAALPRTCEDCGVFGPCKKGWFPKWTPPTANITPITPSDIERDMFGGIPIPAAERRTTLDILRTAVIEGEGKLIDLERLANTIDRNLFQMWKRE